MRDFVIVICNLAIAGVIMYFAIKLLTLVFDFGIDIWNKGKKKQHLIAGGIFMALLLLVPLILSGNAYILRTCTMVLVYTMLALSLNIILGYAGQFSMGHAAFYGLGAYATALVSTNFGWNFLVCMLISIAVAGFFGLILGIPTLRLKGDYLAIVTIGFAEIIRLILVNWIPVTKGPAGITGIKAPSLFGISLKSGAFYYYYALLLVVLIIVISIRISKSRLGRGLKAVRDDETAAEAMGINPTMIKVFAFTLGSALAGMAGSFYAQYIRYVNPDNFNYSESVSILCMVVLGGMGSIPGVCVGACILAILPEALRDIATYRYVIYGILLIMMMIIRPQGMISELSLRGGCKDGRAASGRKRFQDLWRFNRRK